MMHHQPPAGPTVLVVEDEAVLRLDAVDILEARGFTAIEAANAEEALKVMVSRPDVRVLFTDIQMPGVIDGMHLASLVHQRWPNVLLLVTSARLRIDDSHIPDDGRFIAKPYCERDLIGNIQDMLNRR